MISDIKLFDCTIRESGYQTGWYFDSEFIREWYQLLNGAGVDYMELGFFHDQDADPNRGIYRYCSQKNDEIVKVLSHVKTRMKLSSMLDIQRPMSEILTKSESPIDMIRLINRSHENNDYAVKRKVEELQNKGYEVSINFTSSGKNTRETNRHFLKLGEDLEVDAVYFADTESIFTEEYVLNLIEDASELGIENYGLHLHDKKGRAETLFELSYARGCTRFDGTLMGFGGKWHDWNLTIEYLFKKFKVDIDPVEFNNCRRDLVQQLIKYKEFDTAIIE